MVKQQTINMRSVLTAAMVTLTWLLLPSESFAQPSKTRVLRTPTAGRGGVGAATPTASRASLMFPTAVAVPEQVTWRRDIYRSLDLTKDENAALYYPTEPQGNAKSLFTLLFQLFSTGKLPVYEYDISGVENFNSENRMHFRDFASNFSIPYQDEGNRVVVNPADIPSNEVLSYYLKESSYYDQNTATYHTRVVALCPVLHRADDFSMDVMKRPMFWVKMEDAEPFLSQQMLMTSNLNNAAEMSMADFFATNKYKGTIYMTTNMQGKLLSDMVADRMRNMSEPASMDSLMKQEQRHIEQQLTDFEQHIWATPVDSAEMARQDSIAAASAKAPKKARVSRAAASGTKATPRSSRRSSSGAAKDQKAKSSSSSPAPARVSVRRQRH